MKLHLYESLTAPPKRRFIAEFELLPEAQYVVIHGPTAEIAEAKANLHLRYRQLPPKERKAFDLQGQLAALNDGRTVEVAAEKSEEDGLFGDLL